MCDVDACLCVSCALMPNVLTMIARMCLDAVSRICANILCRVFIYFCVTFMHETLCHEMMVDGPEKRARVRDIYTRYTA